MRLGLVALVFSVLLNPLTAAAQTPLPLLGAWERVMSITVSNCTEIPGQFQTVIATGVIIQ